MPAHRKLTARQLKLLIEFAENHLDIAMGRISWGPLADLKHRQAWHNIALQLNAIGDGVQKTPYQWRRYWIDLKAKTKTKAADPRRHVVKKTGGPNKLVPLNELERRVLALVDPVAVKKLLKVSPVDEKPTTPQPEPEANERLDDSSSEFIITKVERPESAASVQEGEGYGVKEEEVYEEQEEGCEEHNEELEDQECVTQSTSTTENRIQPEFLVYSGPSHYSPRLKIRRQRQRRQGDNVPRWVYNLERRRIAAEERHATAMETLVHILGDIRDHITGSIPSPSNCYFEGHADVGLQEFKLRPETEDIGSS